MTCNAASFVFWKTSSGWALRVRAKPCLWHRQGVLRSISLINYGSTGCHKPRFMSTFEGHSFSKVVRSLTCGQIITSQHLPDIDARQPARTCLSTTPSGWLPMASSAAAQMNTRRHQIAPSCTAGRPGTSTRVRRQHEATLGSRTCLASS